MEVRNHKLLKYCIESFDHVYISTGTANESDLKDLKKLLIKGKYAIMHCVSSYPCDPKNANLPRINLLQKMFNRVGYSDHVLGIDASIASLEYNTLFIEKHFTINHDLPGRDNKFAILPNQLKILPNILKIKAFDINHGINFQQCEAATRNEYSGRFSLT